MEQLLQEVSLEDKSTTTHSTTHSKKKSKKKKKKKSAAHSVAKVEQSKKPEVVGEKSSAEVLSDSGRLKNDEMSVHPENEDMNREPSPEPMPELMQISQDEKCQSDMVPTSFVHPDKTIPTEVEHSTKKPSGLNPNALVFQPQESVSMAESSDTRTPLAGKRKFDEYIISVPFEDVVSDAGSAFDNGSLEDDLSDLEEDTVDESGHERDRRRWRKQRRREEDAALEWQLQQVYASTSSLFGWDFSRQCELPGPGANLPWSESTLWRTAPKEVVRYFSPGNGDAYSRLHAPHFLPVPSGPPPSRYYFNPGPPMPYGPPLLPPPGMEPMPPHLHGSFCFQPPEFPMVVSSPDFSSAQYDPSNHEDQVDV
ncbi:unnamed protein product [Phytophthora lilii]|uniref:Unnamed protein product n=1 Tax=Phytophthora lilii TaxID=2077276 RepID=A0A9W6TAT3_9STRA|nr:unnamed protein product [Phytophthora lilii]